MKQQYSARHCEAGGEPIRSIRVLWLQRLSISWMAVECALSLLASWRAHSSVLLAFGSDSLVEFLSAGVVLMRFSPRFDLSEDKAARFAAVLLYCLAGTVAVIAALSLTFRWRPESSELGIVLSGIALIFMPMLGWLKRKEARRLNSASLAADAVQSATCAYLAAITLVGLGVNALFHIGWLDSAAALVAIPLLLREAREAGRGNACTC